MMFWNYRKDSSIENRNTFKNYSKRLKSIIKLTQKARNNNIIERAPNKTKATWNIINNNRINKLPNSDIKEIKHGDKVLTDPNEIVEAFNSFYINHVQPTNKNERTSMKTVNWNKPNSMFMCASTSDDILKIIKSLKNTPSTGYDEITTKVLKYVANIISPVLSYINNLCIDCGMYPDRLKLSIVKPLFKKQDRGVINNYRLVALVPVLSKVFEKYIHASLYSYFETYGILSDEQIGSRGNMSINIAIYNLVKTVMTGRERKLPVHALFMDLTKAFDHVDHKILIAKLEIYGVRSNILNLIHSYLSNRFQQTQITNICTKTKTEQIHMSSVGIVKYGVPQGSVLGPLLFIIYINDMPQTINHPMVLFADDSTAIFVGEKNKPLVEEINKALSNIIQWLKSNNLLINLDKTKIMTFYKNDKLTSKICYNGNDIQEVTLTKFLGLNLDSNLNWKTHVDSVCSKLSNYSYALYMLSKVVNQQAVLTSYHAHVTSILRYGIIFWGNCSERDSIFKNQKKCLRSVCHLKQTDSCKPYFKKFNILTFPCLYIYEIALFTRKNLHLHNFFKNVRNKNKICMPVHRTACFGKSVCGMGPIIYNHLPQTILKSESVTEFKKKLFNLLVMKAYYKLHNFLEDKLSQ